MFEKMLTEQPPDFWIARDLSSDGGHPVLVSQEGVHGHTVLDDQRSDGNEGQNLEGGQ